MACNLWKKYVQRTVFEHFSLLVSLACNVSSLQDGLTSKFSLLLLQAAAALQTYCQQELNSIHTRVHVAQMSQTLDMTPSTPTYQALLSSDVLSHVALRSMGDYKLGWLQGLVHPASEQEPVSFSIDPMQLIELFLHSNCM